MYIPTNLYRGIIILVITFLFLLCLNGCITFTTVRPEYLESDTTKDIVVYTFDGKTIRMLGGDYQILRGDDTLYLCGKGQLLSNEKFTDMKPFISKLLFKEIKNIETREKSIFYYTGPILFGTTMVFLIFVVIIYGGRGAGG